MLLAAFTTPPQSKNNTKKEVVYKSAKDDRTINAMGKHTFVAYIKKFILQYQRVFSRKGLYFYLTELQKSSAVPFLSRLWPICYMFKSEELNGEERTELQRQSMVLKGNV